jgi:hypothetical protein
MCVCLREVLSVPMRHIHEADIIRIFSKSLKGQYWLRRLNRSEDTALYTCLGFASHATTKKPCCLIPRTRMNHGLRQSTLNSLVYLDTMHSRIVDIIPSWVDSQRIHAPGPKAGRYKEGQRTSQLSIVTFGIQEDHGTLRICCKARWSS